MKKTYALILSIALFAFGFSQSPIVTVDRANGSGPTASGNDTTISSEGLTRGAGVNQRNGTDFSSNNWTGVSQADADTNNDYIEWSLTTNAFYDVEVTELDIRLRRNTNGPTDWQIFYSTDDFATSTALTTAQTLAANTNTNFNFNSLSVSSGSSATLKFRLYAWGAATNGGWLRVRGRTAWSGFGIANPGIRITGNITALSTNSDESNIVTTSFDPSDNIDYTLYSATSGLTSSNAIKVAEFTIQDGGDDGTDADAVGTTLTDIELDISNFDALAALALFDGTTNIAEVTSVTETTVFSGINSGTGITATDEGTKTFSVYATFGTTITDNSQLEFTVSSATVASTGSSIFDSFDAGGASTPITGDDNRLEVTATELSFAQEPSDANQFEVMLPYPTVQAVDTNDNIDLDFTSSISLTTTGTFDASATTSVSAVVGESSFSNVVYSATGTAITITAASTGITSATSASFDVNGPLIDIAIQDFDGASPEWTYTNDIAFFDNGWGTDGYYDLIDIDDAAPLDNPQFTDNILGENDLNDEGDNGTTGWATITFATIDVSAYENIKVKFDWEVEGYRNNSNDAQYRLIYDGINQPRVFLHDGNGVPESGEGHVTVDVPGTVDEVALEIRVRNNRLEGFSGFDNFRIVSEFDGLLYTGGSWTPNAPSATTSADNALVLDGTYTITSSDIEINDFIVHSGATTEIDKASSLTVEGNLINKGTLELDSDSDEYSSLIVEGISTDDIIYKRHVNNTATIGEDDSNDLISAPVSGEAFDDFKDNNSNIVSNGTSTLFLFGPFDKSTANYVLYADTETSTLDAGNGYRAASTNSDTFTFTGAVNTQTINKSILNSGPAHAEWNLIGNPYPSYIKLSDFLSANNTEFDAPTAGIYGYDGDASDGWTIWNQAYSDANPDAIIAPGQGFLVSSKSGGGTISFTPSMRATGSSDDFIAGRPAQSTDNGYITLSLNNLEKSYKTNLYFNPNASLGLDNGYDAAIFGDVAPIFAIYSHLVENNTGKDMAVQSVSFESLNNIVIPLGINAVQGEQVTVSIADSLLPEDTEVILEDNIANTFTDLRLQDYTIAPSTALAGTGRYYIHFSRQQLNISDTTLSDIQIFTKTSPNQVVVKGQLFSDTRAKLIDIQGRTVNSVILNTATNINYIDVSELTTGVYILQLQNNSGSRSQKVIIK